MLLYTKERSRVIRSLKMSDVSDPLVNPTNRSKKRAIHWQNLYLSYVFDSFPPFLFPRANRSHRSLFICSILKSDLSDSLPLLFTKEQPWAICSRGSFAHKKRAIRWKNLWDNSQPCQMYTNYSTVQVTLVCKSDQYIFLNLSSYILRGRKMNHLIMWFSEL